MKFRKRLFLFVACFFLIMQVIFLLWTYYAVTNHVNEAEVSLEKEIKEYNHKQVKDYVSFLTLSLAEAELRIHALFDKIQEFGWLKKRYEPSEYNFRTRQWSNSTILIASHPWIDFVQTTVREELTSLILMRPPFLHPVYSFPLAKGVMIIVGKSHDGVIEPYIGVPYWSNEMGSEFEVGMHDVLFSLDTSRNNWLLFHPDQLLQMSPDEVIARDTTLPYSPIDPTVTIHSEDLYRKLIDATREMIFAVQIQLKQNPEILEKLHSREWLKKKIDTIERGERGSFTRGLDLCDSHICRLIKNSKSEPWADLHDWRERDDQNRLIWELGTITGTGLWHFDPLDHFAPIGIASFPKASKAKREGTSTNIGYSILSSDVFRGHRLDVHPQCTPEFIPGEANTCLSQEFEILRPPHDDKAVYLANTLLYELAEEKNDEPAFGSLTVGVNIAPILEKLALISPDRVLFLPKEGEPLVFNTSGEAIDLTSSERAILHQLRGKNEGIATDAQGEQYYFLHVIDLTSDDGQVFIIQYKDNVFSRIEQLKEQAHKFLYAVLFQIFLIGMILFALVLIVINYYVKHSLKPIQALVNATDEVASGELDKVHFNEEYKNRDDEMTVLVNAFEHMVEHMKEGNQVRAVLNKVVNKEVANKILEQGVELGGEVRKIAILFSDIRHFTHISEDMSPHDVLAMLNDCLAVLSRVIDDHKGVIDKYVGDEIMAFFGAPLDAENPTLQAVLCAIAMMRVLTEWNRHRESIGYRQLKVGIGIHVGEVIAGNMGAENHLNYTVLGHNVNLASRLCDHAGEMEILITETALNAPGVRERIEVEPVPPAQFKGISKPVNIYKIKY